MSEIVDEAISEPEIQQVPPSPPALSIEEKRKGSPGNGKVPPVAPSSSYKGLSTSSNGLAGGGGVCCK